MSTFFDATVGVSIFVAFLRSSSARSVCPASSYASAKIFRVCGIGSNSTAFSRALITFFVFPIFSFAVGYFDGEKDHIFVANEEGFIVDEPRGDNLHGWTELLYIYGHPSFPGRSLAELNDEEWQKYLTIIEKVDGLAMLRDYLVRVGLSQD